MMTIFKPLMKRRLRHKIGFMVYDAVAICAALTIAIALRMNGAIPAAMLHGMAISLPVFLISGLVIFQVSGVYERIWRLGSLGDLSALVESATISIVVPVFVLVITSNARWMPSSVPIIQWFVLVALLAGGRLWRRILSERLRTLRLVSAPPDRIRAMRSRQRALIVGIPEYVEIILRQLETAPDPDHVAVGILDVSDQNVTLRLRHVPVLGGIDALEHVVGKLASQNQRPTSLIIAEGGAGLTGPAKLKLVTAAEMLGLTVLRATAPTAISRTLDLETLNLADLLDRPQARLDERVVARVIAGKRVLVTGAGGTIGRELVRQLAAIGPSEIVLLEACEYNLYAVELELRENFPEMLCTPLLCSIRQRAHVMAAFARHRPDFVFHAAALKHVPLVETNICAGVQTNVLGTRNVADAASRYGARAMVQVSTDKAVNPVGVMGASKRLGELYCQALDLEGAGNAAAPRFMTVRFGNVLGSSGSLIPLLQRQLKRRAPLTVTHPEITRYFMTVHEAVQLILHSTARAMEADLHRGRIIVLAMGEPVKIIDIARRMIRLAGLEPERDVPIKIVGLRPGEKLYEELFDEREKRLPSVLPGVFEAAPTPVAMPVLRAGFNALGEAIRAHDEDRVKRLLFRMLETEQFERIPKAPRPAAIGAGQQSASARAAF